MQNSIKPWRDPTAHDPEKAAARLKRRFARISRRLAWRARRRPLGRALALAALTIAIATAIGWTLIVAFSPFSTMDTIRHLASFPSCAVARAVGLTPARRNQPGYWAHHDNDHDGIACKARRRPSEPGVYHVR